MWKCREMSVKTTSRIFKVGDVPTVLKYYGEQNVTRLNKIAIQGTPHMAVDKEAISLSRLHS